MSKVVIKKTTNKRMGAMNVLSPATHKKIVKNAMSKLYSVVPVYRMLTVRGFSPQTNQLFGNIINVIGAASPIAQEFIDESIVKTVNVINLDSEGNPCGVRTITTGVECKGKRYVYSNTLLMVKFDMMELTDEDRDIANHIYDSLIAKGIWIKDGISYLEEQEGAEKVDVLVATPSNERNRQLIATSENPDIAWEKLEKVGGHAFSNKLTKNISLAKFAKLAKRLGIFASPAIPFARVGNDSFGLVIIDTDVLGTDDYSTEDKIILKDMGIDIDAKQFDGIVWTSNNYVMQGLKDLGITGITAAQATFFAPQGRTEVIYSKCFMETVDQLIINRMYNNLFNRFSSAIKIIGNKDSIGMIVDSNGAKLLDLDFSFPKEGIMTYILDIAKASQTKTDNQLTYKLMSMDKNKTITAYKKLSKADMSEFNNGFGDIINQSIIDDNFNTPNKLLMNLAKNYSNETFAQEVFSDKFIARDIIKEGVKKHESAFRNGQVKIDSCFLRIAFDASSVIVNGLAGVLKTTSTGAIEVFSNDVLWDKKDQIAIIEESNASDYQKKKLLDKLLTGFIVKNPAVGREELQLVRCLTMNEVLTRVGSLFLANKINEEDKNLLANYFLTTSYGMLKVAPSNTMKHKLAGLDTDFDGVKLVMESDLVDIVVAYYEKQANKIEKQTELLNVSYGGIVPFIDSASNAKRLIGETLTEAAVTTDKEFYTVDNLWN